MTIELLDLNWIDKEWVKSIRVDGDCWLWEGLVDPANGFGVIRDGSRTYLAYRHIYESTIGPPPKGLKLIQMCGNKLCVNPNHVEVDTSSDYISRRRAHEEEDEHDEE